MSANTSRVFISYATADGTEAAADVMELLASNNLTVWQDKSKLTGERDWWSQIDQVLRAPSLEHVVVVVTPGSLASKEVRKEIQLARAEGKTVSPILGPGLARLVDVPRSWGNVFDLASSERRDVFINVLRGPGRRPRVQMMAPEPPRNMVPRDKAYENIKRALLDESVDAVGITAALKGAGGYGKTTLAMALAHDPEIRESFYDGALWVEVGAHPENLTASVTDLVERLTGARPGVEDLNSAGAELGRALGELRILLIIDDVWREHDLLPFLRGGKRTTRLITTRNGSLLPQDVAVSQVNAMTPDEALVLLSSGLPVSDVDQCKSDLQSLAAELGEWPLLLGLANSRLRFDCRSGRPVRDAVSHAHERYHKRGVTAFDARSEQDRNNAVAATIEVSLELLSRKDDRKRFYELASFPEDAAVPIQVIEELWHKRSNLDAIETSDLMRELDDLSLVLRLDLSQDTVTLHDTIRDYAARQIESNNQLHANVCEVLQVIRQNSDVSMPALRYVYMYLPYHLKQAASEDELANLLQQPSWIDQKARITENAVSLLSDYDAYGTLEIHTLLLDSLRLSMHISARDPSQTLVQVACRLIGVDDAAAATFVVSAMSVATRPSLFLECPTLAAPGAEIARIDGHEGEVTSLRWLSDKRLASGASDTTVRIWGDELFEEQQCLQGHADWVVSIAEVNGTLFTGSEDKSVNAWKADWRSPEPMATGLESGVIALTPVGTQGIVAGTWDGTVLLSEDGNEYLSIQLDATSGSVAAVLALDNGQVLCGCGDGQLRSINAGHSVEILGTGHNSSITSLAELPRGCVASGSVDGTVTVWETESGRSIRQYSSINASVRSMCALADGRLVVGDSEGFIRVFRDDGKPGEVIKAHTNSVNALAADGSVRFASGSSDGTIKIWMPDRDNAPKREVWPTKHNGSVVALDYQRDGTLFSASWDRTVIRWQVGSESLALKNPEPVDVQVDAPIASLSVLGGEAVAIGCVDGSLLLGRTGSGPWHDPVRPHDGQLTAITYLGDGRFATSSHDTTIKLWTLGQTDPLRVLSGHDYWVAGLSYLGSDVLLSASWDGTVRRWNLDDDETGTVITQGCCARVVTHRDSVIAVGFDDGEVVVLHSVDGELRRISRDMSVVALDWLDDHLLAIASERVVEIRNAMTGEMATQIELDVRLRSLLAIDQRTLLAGDVAGTVHVIKYLDG